uniref:Uncharacterized protein n=1 Tax=Anguilla anguilla TaxID=7936 RepID=A0A0E9SJ52_ANGAN
MLRTRYSLHIGQELGWRMLSSTSCIGPTRMVS